MLIAAVIDLAGFRFQIAHLNLDVCRHIIVVWVPLIGLQRVIYFFLHGWSAELLCRLQWQFDTLILISN